MQEIRGFSCKHPLYSNRYFLHSCDIQSNISLLGACKHKRQESKNRTGTETASAITFKVDGEGP